MSDIIVKFQARGHEAIVAAINKLENSTLNLTTQQKKSAKTDKELIALDRERADTLKTKMDLEKHQAKIAAKNARQQKLANNAAAKLTAKIKAQNLTWKQLGISSETLKKAYKGNRIALEKMRIAMKRTIRAGGGMVRNQRLLNNSLATMRSKLLLVNFAMAMGVRQMLDFQKQAGKLKAMETGFNTLSGGVGNAAISMAKLKAATNGTMSEMSLFQQANSAMILGVTKNSDEMAEMFDMAQRLGRTLGVDTERSIESLVTGLGRQSVKMLDNIGIIVKSNEAYEKYAKANNKVASELTDSEKRQAFFNAALESGRKKMKSLGPEVSTTQDSFDRFNVTMSELGTEFGELTSPAVAGFMDEFSDWVFNLSAGPLEKMAKDMGDLGIQLKDFEGFSQRLADTLSLKELEELEGSTNEIFRRINVNFENLGISQETIDSILGRPFWEKMLFTDQQALLHAAIEWNQEAGKTVTDMFKKFGVTIDQQIKMVGGQAKWHTMIDPSTIDLEAINKELERVIAQMGEKLDENLSEMSKPERIELLRKLKEGGFVDDEALERELSKLGAEADLLVELIALANQYKAIINEDTEETDENTQSTKAATAASGSLNDTIKERNELLKKQMTAISRAATGFAKLGKELGVNEKAIMALQAVAALANAHMAASDVLADAKIRPTWLRVAAAAGMYAQGIAHVMGIKKAESQAGSAVGKFEQGGYVGGRPHSQGGTIIEAERGEFVMSRNAVESIGLETISQLNEGGGGSVNVTVTGNVMTQDFVEGELAESIKEAVRRGSDFGIS